MKIIKSDTMKKNLLLLFLLFIFISCNKEKKALKKIQGQWNVTSMIINDVQQLDYLHSLGGTLTMEFESCDKGATCNLTTTTNEPSNTITDVSTYSISENTTGSSDLIMTINDTSVYKISNLTDENMTLFQPVGEVQPNGAVVTNPNDDVISIDLVKL